MKKKVLITMLSLVLVIACAFGLTACGLFGGGNKHEHEYDTLWADDETYHWHGCFAGGDCDAPEKDKAEHVDANNDGYCDVCEHGGMTVKQDAPVEIVYSFTDTEITVEDAYYGTDKTTSSYTEYRLDDGEWQKLPATGGRIQYNGLTPASTHILYARKGEKDNFTASDAFSVTVTLKKTRRDTPPSADAVSYEVTGKTTVFTLTDGIELSVDGGKTYLSEHEITHTYTDAGEQIIRIRYAETDTVYASGYVTIRFITTGFASGKGTEESPYLIGTLEQFKALKDYSGSNSWFAFTADIVCDDEVWAEDNLYDVHIDGRGHKITGLKQSAPLFTTVSEAKDITIENAVYNAKISEQGERSIANPAILAGRLEFARNVHVSGSINVTAPNGNVTFEYFNYSLVVGGICAVLEQNNEGGNYGINHSSADITVSLPNIKEKMDEHLVLDMGGLAGMVLPYNTREHTEFASIYACSANLVVTGAHLAEANIGGLVGGMSSEKFGPTATIDDCYTTGSINLDFYAYDNGLHSGDLRVGGIAPEITGSISSCYSTIDIDINAHLTKRMRNETDTVGVCDARVYVGGICTNAHNETGFTVKQSLERCLFAGTIKVRNLATENAGGTFKLNAVCVDDTVFADDGKTDLYYKSGVTDTLAGDKEILVNSNASAVEESVYTTTEWQKQSLKITGEYYWVVEDGKLPTLK